jgi:hypothetical protein
VITSKMRGSVRALRVSRSIEVDSSRVNCESLVVVSVISGSGFEGCGSGFPRSSVGLSVSSTFQEIVPVQRPHRRHSACSCDFARLVHAHRDVTRGLADCYRPGRRLFRV